MMTPATRRHVQRALRTCRKASTSFDESVWRPAMELELRIRTAWQRGNGCFNYGRLKLLHDALNRAADIRRTFQGPEQRRKLHDRTMQSVRTWRILADGVRDYRGLPK